MDFFNKLGDTIVSATQGVSEKAKGMTDIAKLQYEMKTKEEFLNKKYQEIGKMFYQTNKEAFPDEYTELFDEVEATVGKIGELKDKIATLKGGKTCPKCGAMVGNVAAFCSECGAKMEDIFEEEDDVTEDVEVEKTEESEVVDE